MRGFTMLIDLVDNDPTAHLTIVARNDVPKLDDLQKSVGGLIEPLFTIESPEGGLISGYVNEEFYFVFENAPPTGMVVTGTRGQPWMGPMIILGVTDEGNSRLLSRAETEWLFKNWYPTSALDMAALRVA